MTPMSRVAWTSFLVSLVAGCASEPRPVRQHEDPTSFRVSCQADHQEVEPCIAEARRTCTAPKLMEASYHVTPYTASVDQYAKALYEYVVTYSCPAP